MRLILPLFTGFILLASPALAQQNTLPAFSLPRGQEEGIVRLPPPAGIESIDEYAFFGPNQYLRDLIKLQYQNYVLEALLARQSEIERVAEAYANLGIDYRRPAPPLGVCRELPANALCMSFYPNLYPEVMQGAASQMRQQVEEIVTLLQQADAQTQSIIDKAKNAEATETTAEEVDVSGPEREYRWSDITCLAGVCEAVIKDVKNAAFAQTVRLGDVLPGGAQIVGISAAGVDIVQPEEEEDTPQRVAMAPLPIGGIEAVPTEENPFGIPGLINLDDVSLPPGFSLDLPGGPAGIPPVTVSEESLATITGENEIGQPLAVQSTDEDGAIVDEVQDLSGVEEAQPVLPATGLTF